MNINSGSAKLVLLCPAWKKWGTARTVKVGSVILHSRADDVIPFADSEELVRNSGLLTSALVEVGSDHRLADQEPLEAMLRACGEKIVGSDFGVPASAGQQAKKIILIEAVRLGERSYSIRPTGRNERLVRHVGVGESWKHSRRGWTVPDLAESLASDPTVTVSAFDFPFSIPLALLNDSEFAQLVGQASFRKRSIWAKYVGDNLRLEFATGHAGAKLTDLAKFDVWRDKRFWKKRRTDQATGGSPPLKDKFQNVFAMTLAGNAMLERLGRSGIILSLSSATMPQKTRTAIETYPAAVANRIGFKGNYKREPEECLQQAERYLAAQGIRLDCSKTIRKFCLEYRTSGKSKDDPDPDGADAFLCLVAAICFRENLGELCCDGARSAVLDEEACIIAPKRVVSTKPPSDVA
jgi:hypothetical protein